MFRAHGSMTVGQFKLGLEARGVLYSPFHGELETSETLQAYGIDGSFPLYFDQDEIKEEEYVEPFVLEDAPGHEIFLVPIQLGLVSGVTKKTRKKPSLEKQLDGYALIAGCGVDLPEECYKCVLSALNKPLKEVVVEHLHEFVNLSVLELNENSLELEPLGLLPALEELHLVCNKIQRLDLTNYSLRPQPPAPYFPKLSVLNLSFNFLNSQSLLELTYIPTLIDLNVSSNGFTELPRDLSGFTALRRLSVRDNKLGEGVGWKNKQSGPRLAQRDAQVLRSLASIPNLEEIDLAENFLCEVSTIDSGFNKLRFLNLSANSLAESIVLIPLRNFPQLEWVDVRGNPLTSPLQSRANSKKKMTAEFIMSCFPVLYETLTLERGVKIVFLDPTEKSKSFLERNTHILRPPSAVIRHSNHALEEKEATDLHRRNTAAMKKRVEQLEETQRGNAVENVYEEEEEEEDGAEEDDVNVFLTGMSATESKYNEGNRQVATTRPYEVSGHALANPHTQAKLFDILPDEPFVLSNLSEARSHNEVVKATRKLSHVLNNPIQVVVVDPAAVPRYAVVHQDHKKRMEHRAKRDYSLNNHSNAKGNRKSKVAAVYAQMHDVLDAIATENNDAGALNTEPYKKSHEAVRADSGYYDKKHEAATKRRHARRNKEKERTSVQMLLNTISTSLAPDNA